MTVSPVREFKYIYIYQWAKHGVNNIHRKTKEKKNNK